MSETYWYQCQERAMAPGIGDGWPEIIPAPHTKNARLVRRSDPHPCPTCKSLQAEKQAVYEQWDGAPVEQINHIPLPQFIATRYVRVIDHNETIDDLQTQLAEREEEVERLKADLAKALRTLLGYSSIVGVQGGALLAITWRDDVNDDIKGKLRSLIDDVQAQLSKLREGSPQGPKP